MLTTIAFINIGCKFVRHEYIQISYEFSRDNADADKEQTFGSLRNKI
jgi:hypothetical protein